MTFSDDELREYLQGRANEDLAARIEAAVESDPALEERLHALDLFAEHVKNAFDQVSPGPLPKIPANSNRPGTLVSLGVAATLAAVAFFAGSWSARPDTGWHSQVAAYQALYVAETVAPLNAENDTLKKQFQRAEKALGHAVAIEALANLDGLSLKRAQILGFNGAPLIQIVFADDSGAPIALCLMAQEGQADAQSTILSGLPAVHWKTDGVGYILIGGEDIKLLERTTDTLQQVL